MTNESSSSGKGNYLLQRKEKFLEGVGGEIAGGTFSADDFQRQAIESVVEGIDTLVVAPTGSGKTFIALESIRTVLQLNLKAVYTTPLKALSNTKYTELKKKFEPEYTVGLLTGDRKIDGDSSIVVATTEIYRNELYQAPERFSLVVLDEVHYIADQNRGPVWEESIILTPASTTLLMLSASISNAEEIAAWIEDVRGKPCRIIIKKERPVELRFGFFDPEYGVLPLHDDKGELFHPISRFYSSFGLEPGGMRLKKRKGFREEHGERSGHRRGSGGRAISRARGRGRR